MPVHVINEANRCLQCKNPRCRMEGCPIRTNIPEVIRLFKENRMMEAAEILFQNNPLSVVCSLVCNHEDSAKATASAGSRESLFTFLLLRTISRIPASRGWI